MAKEEYENEEYENDENEEDEEDELSVGEMIDNELKAIYSAMKNLDRTSQEYMVLCQRAIDLTEQKKNTDESMRNQVQAAEMKGQHLVPWFQVLGNVLGSATGAAVGQLFNRRTVNDVLECEQNGHIISSKSTAFIQKPRS